MTINRRLLSLIADGEYHRGSELAAELRIDANTLHEQMADLAPLGLTVHTSPVQGYRLEKPFELLSADHIRAAMEHRTRALLGNLETHLQIDSTNARLRRSLETGVRKGSACLSESQSDGRGRHGRHWVSPAGGNLYLSIRWQYPAAVQDLSGLSLALGVAVARAIDDIGFRSTGLKWPNDLVWQDRKLGGILVELHGQPSSGIGVIAGVGINTDLPADKAGEIDQPWTDLTRIMGSPVPRNRLAGRLLHHLLETLHGFTHGGLNWQQEFSRRDVLAARPVTLSRPDGGQVQGVARGIDPQGALRIENEYGISTHQVGEPSVRAIPTPGIAPPAEPGKNQ